MNLRTLLLVMIIVGVVSAVAQTKEEHWVATWGAANFAAPGQTSQGKAEREHHPSKPGEVAETLREIVQISAGGQRIRLLLSNEFGDTPLELGGVSVAIIAPNDITHPIPVLFNQSLAIRVAAGESIVSDPIDLPVAPLCQLAISLYLPHSSSGQLTQHAFSNSSNVLAPGNQLLAGTIQHGRPHPRWFYLKSIEVSSVPSAAAIVTLGDSITDGVGSTPGGELRWTDDLARRLQGSPSTRSLTVINKGIAGNRVLHNGVGPSALSRFDRDVLAVSGVKYVILLEGINDIGDSTQPQTEQDIITAPQLIAAYTAMIHKAHKAGLKIIGATLTPYQGSRYASPEGQRTRSAVNQFIRQGRQFDGVIDFAKAVEDPENPLRYLPQYDHGDHLHPDDDGYKAMANAIDLSLFQ